MKDEIQERLQLVEEEYWWNQGRRKILCDIIRKYRNNKKNLKILDVGCGPGGTTVSLVEFGEVFGSDFSKTALDYAVKRNISVFQSTLNPLPIPNNTFDLVTALDVIEHIKDDSGVLQELYNVLKPGGLLIVTVPAYQFLWSEHDLALSHQRRYRVSSLTETLRQSGFTPLYHSYFVSFLFVFVAAIRLLKKFNINKENPKYSRKKLPNSINNLFKKIMTIENKIIKKSRIPFGLSIICVSKKT